MLKKLSASLRTLRVRILVIVALCWLLPTLVLGVYMSSVFFNALRTKTEQALVAEAMHAQELTVQEIERILKKSKDITYDETISERVSAYRAGQIGFEEFFLACRSYWHRTFQRERLVDFSTFFLLDEPENMIYSVENVTTMLMFRDNTLPYILRLGETLGTRSRFAYTDETLYHVRNLYNRKMERFGMLALQINAEGLLSGLRNPRTLWGGEVDILLDEYAYTANAAYPFTQDMYQEGLYQIDGDLYYSQHVKTSDYSLMYRIRLDESVVFGQVHEYTRLILLLLLLLLPLEALIMHFIHRSLTKPLMTLASATTRLAGGELGITVPVSSTDEIGRVGMAFNAMSQQMQQLIDKSYREELALRDARISALQSRINPHFLNNALELMNWQARLEGAETVSQMINSMSTLINATLDRTEERTVPLRTELEVADAYFFFIQQRFGQRIRIIKEIDETLLNVPVPRLIIQTLLENAVDHGINPAGGGTIRLQVYVQDDALFIDVRNNGKTMTVEDQERIGQLLSDRNRDTHSEHMGIRNVNLRLKLIYDEQAGLSLTTDPETFETLARIIIPYRSAQSSTTNDIKNQ